MKEDDLMPYYMNHALVKYALKENSERDAGQKRAIPIEEEEEEEMSPHDSAVLLAGLKGSNISGIDIEDSIPSRHSVLFEAKHVAKSKSKPITEAKAPAIKLKEMSEKTFADGKKKNFSLYFDGGNLQTAGNAYLFKCFQLSHYFELAKFLIGKGARLAPTEETFAGMVAALTGQDRTSVSILMELLKVDPVGTVELFIEASRNSAEKASLDLFLMSLLAEYETGVYNFSTESVVDMFRSLFRSGDFGTSVLFMIERMEVDLDHAQIVEMFVKAVESGDLTVIETLLEKDWLKVDERVTIGRKDLTTISHLFGRFESDRIMNLINKFNYNIHYTHDNTINPEGDILLVALIGKDLESFKRLLQSGASFNVQLKGSMTADLTNLETYTEQKRPQYYDAIQAFKNGTLTELDSASV